MEKIYGAVGRCDGIQQVGRRSWEIFYSYGEDDGVGWNYRLTLDHKPEIEEVRQIILGQINSDVQEEILSGLNWEDRTVWLSAENQRNIVFAASVHSSITLKLGTDNDYVFHTFEGEELADFAVVVQAHIEHAIAKGRLAKSSVDWDLYLI